MKKATSNAPLRIVRFGSLCALICQPCVPVACWVRQCSRTKTANRIDQGRSLCCHGYVSSGHNASRGGDGFACCALACFRDMVFFFVVVFHVVTGTQVSGVRVTWNSPMGTACMMSRYFAVSSRSVPFFCAVWPVAHLVC